MRYLQKATGFVWIHVVALSWSEPRNRLVFLVTCKTPLAGKPYKLIIMSGSLNPIRCCFLPQVPSIIFISVDISLYNSCQVFHQLLAHSAIPFYNFKRYLEKSFRQVQRFSLDLVNMVQFMPLVLSCYNFSLFSIPSPVYILRRSQDSTNHVNGKR